MAEGAVFPPIVVFVDGACSYLADGYHRRRAAEQSQRATIAVELRPGTKNDALWYALGANRKRCQG